MSARFAMPAANDAEPITPPAHFPGWLAAVAVATLVATAGLLAR